MMLSKMESSFVRGLFLQTVCFNKRKRSKPVFNERVSENVGN